MTVPHAAIHCRVTLALAIAVGVASAGCRSSAVSPEPPAVVPASLRTEDASAPGSGCGPDWLAAPVVDPSIAVPEAHRMLLARGAARGTQDYECRADDGGTGAWVLTGPSAALTDCTGAALATHFASDAGAPSWQSAGTAPVVGRKLAAFTPPGSAGSIPWLLLEASGGGAAGSLVGSAFVQRLHTQGGVAPASPCQAGAVERVPYSADYYFYGP
jgi:hypothetical protein